MFNNILSIELKKIETNIKYRMAVRILFSCRQMMANKPLKVCVTSNASMSSSSSDKPVKKRESFRSVMATIFGGHYDPADPKDGPIPAEKVMLPEMTEQATGENKLFLLAFENGILDPYCNLATKRNGRGTKDNPVPIESFSNERMVGCVCEPTQNYLKFTIVHKGEPKRCQCGHWMELVDAPRFWEKIPKEDLLTIPEFLELELEGKLDKFLAGEIEEEKPHASEHH